MRGRVTVVDLGLGNLGSVLQALVRAGGEPRLSADAGEIGRAARIVLPGVAAFGLGMERAARLGLRGALDAALHRGAPVLGICLGMQILFEEGEEDGLRQGLGFLPGRVTRLPAGVQVPHIGWPQSEPVTSARKVKQAPIGAAALAATSASGCRQTRVPSAARLITPQTNIESHAFGT